MTKARKEHKCDLCGQTIYVGELYINRRYTPWDCPDNEAFWGLKACRFCWDHSEGKWDYSWGEGWTLDNLVDTLIEVIVSDILEPAYQAVVYPGDMDPWRRHNSWAHDIVRFIRAQ